MKYIDKFKTIYKDWWMSNLDRDYHTKTNPQHLIVNSSRYLSEVFHRDNFIVNDKQQYFGNKETFKHLTMGFWDNDIPFRRLLENDEKVIVQAGLHPITDSIYPIYDTKRWFFDLFLEPNVVRKMKNGTLVLLLYQGWEAEDYTDEIYSRVKADKYKNYYDMFRDVLEQYKLPKSSMIILSSNLFGNDHEDYGVNVIYDNIMEWNSLHRGIAKSYARRMLKETGHDFRSVNIDYSVDEYLETIKNNDKRICRLSRTKHQQRDWMLYLMKKNNWLDKSLVEQKFFNRSHIECDKYTAQTAIDFCNNNKEYKYLIDNFRNIDKEVIQKLEAKVPMIASNYETHPKFKPDTIHSNLPIPYDVYNKSVFSWVSTSLPDRTDMVFLNQSTFNPILFYHPIMWLGSPKTTEYFKKYGFKSYEWLFENESKADNAEIFSHKLIYNLHDLNKVMNMSNDELYNRIKDNKDTLVHNRNLLIRCKSIDRIITQIYEMIYETEV